MTTDNKVANGKIIVKDPKAEAERKAKARKRGNMESDDMVFLQNMRGTLGGGLKKRK